MTGAVAVRPLRGRGLARIGDRLLAHERAIYGALALIALVPVWIVDRFPSQDGPHHLYVTYLIDRLRDADGGAFRALFELNPYLEPNSTVYWLLRGFGRFMPLLMAEKVVVSLYWLVLVIGARYAVTAHGREQAPLAFLFLPFGFGYFLHFGFYNFSLATVGFLALLGFALRHLERPRWPALLVIGAGAFALVVTHLFGLMMFLATVGLARIGAALRDAVGVADPGAKRAAWRALFADGLKIALVCVPAFVVAASFIARHISGESHPNDPVSTSHIIGVLLLVEPIFALSHAELISLAPFIALIWTLAAVALRRVWTSEHSVATWLPIILPPLVLLGVYLLGTLQVKHFAVQGRLLPYFFFTLILAVAAIGLPGWARRLIVPVVALVSAATAVERGRFYRQADARTAAFVQGGAAVAPQSTFLTVYAVGADERRGPRSNGLTVDVMEHADALLAIDRDAVMLSANLLSPSKLGYFPAGYRADRDPFRDAPPPTASRRIAWHEARIGQPVDYIVVWPARRPTPEMTPAARARMTAIFAEVPGAYAALPDTAGGPLVLRRLSSGR